MPVNIGQYMLRAGTAGRNHTMQATACMLVEASYGSHQGENSQSEEDGEDDEEHVEDSEEEDSAHSHDLEGSDDGP